MAKENRSPKKTPGKAAPKRRLTARPDTLDFRDLLFSPTLVEVPAKITLADYRRHYADRVVPILDQKSEGACTGYGLAAVANFLLHSRKQSPSRTGVSATMLYQLAKRYDEWSGEKYDGSSARGTMKGWQKHGVCADALWPRGAPYDLTLARTEDAARRPLGAYYRVNHKDVVAMHSALAEVGILFASAVVHTGWDEVKTDGLIAWNASTTVDGGHAFAIVGYDIDGFWIQNSWGRSWGKGGFAHISYADWLSNGTDVWVARLGAPVRVEEISRSLQAGRSGSSRYSLNALRPHFLGLENEGQLRKSGETATTREDLARLFAEDFPRITKGWKKKRILFYAHGGLVSEKNALGRIEEYRRTLLAHEIYPIAFVWRTDFWMTLRNILEDCIRKRRPEGFIAEAKDFLLDRVDDSLEVLGNLPGGALWREMKENAVAATTDKEGGIRFVLQELTKLLASSPAVELHVAAHSAGSILLGPLVEALTSNGSVSTATLWAPACTTTFFKAHYLPAIRNGAIGQFTLFNLKDGAERDDNCAGIYNKSLLYLVSNSFELAFPKLFGGSGEPILGLERSLFEDATFKLDPALIRKTNPPCVQLLGLKTATLVRAPNDLDQGLAEASHAHHHGDFDDDPSTVLATLAIILKSSKTTSHITFAESAQSLSRRRQQIERVI